MESSTVSIVVRHPITWPPGAGSPLAFPGEEVREACRSAACPLDLGVSGPEDRSQIVEGDMVMKYMLVMRATDEAFASMADADFGKMLEIVGKFNDELIRAGVLLAAEGLADAAEGVVVDFSSEPPVITDGPYGETKELFGGFYLLNVASKEEAVEWAKRLPIKGPGFNPEIRRVTTIDEFPQVNDRIKKHS